MMSGLGSQCIGSDAQDLGKPILSRADKTNFTIFLNQLHQIARKSLKSNPCPKEYLSTNQITLLLGNINDEANSDSESETEIKLINSVQTELPYILNQSQPFALFLNSNDISKLKQSIQKAIISPLKNLRSKSKQNSYIQSLKSLIQDHLEKNYRSSLEQLKKHNPFDLTIQQNDESIQHFAYKELATWQWIINGIIKRSQFDFSTKKHYLKLVKNIFGYQHYAYFLQEKYGAPSFFQKTKQTILHHRFFKQILDNESDCLPMNIADHRFFDTFKQNIGLVKIIERFLGVQTIYFLETLFNSFEDSSPPCWLFFLKDSLFYHFNFILQTLDSAFFAMGALITSRDQGFRRWSKVAFACIFWLCALMPILGFGASAFKFIAIALGILKSLLDLRYYALKVEKSEFEVEKIAVQLHYLDSNINPYQLGYLSHSLKQFKARKVWLSANKKLAQAKQRIRDKRFALLASGITLAAMIIMTALGTGTLFMSWLVCALFLVASGIKFFYRILTYNQDAVDFALVEGQLNHQSIAKKIDSPKELKEHMYCLDPKDPHYQSAKKDLLDVQNKSSNVYRLFSTKKDFGERGKIVKLLESAFAFDNTLFKDQPAILQQLTRLEAIKADLPFYLRTKNNKQVHAYHVEVNSIRQAIESSNASELTACLKKIRHIATTLEAQDKPACRLFLMELFHKIDEDFLEEKDGDFNIFDDKECNLDSNKYKKSVELLNEILLLKIEESGKHSPKHGTNS